MHRLFNRLSESLRQSSSTQILGALFLASSLSAACVHDESQMGAAATPQTTAQAPESRSEDGGQQFAADDQSNAAGADAKPYVILVSIDGYRWDYNRLFAPAELTRIETDGVAAKSLIPVYPSKTFPNHYAIATGLYANHNGIVSNEFYDPKRDAIFSLPNRAAVEDGSWYFGEPLWVSVRKQGLLSASYFWVGSDAKIAGEYPNYYYRYDQSTPNERRVDQVLKWLQMPAEKRPHFITLYFSDVDSAGHHFGLKSHELSDAVLKVDSSIAQLRKGLSKIDLPVNLIIVSDHGMTDVDPGKMIMLDEAAPAAQILSKFRVMGRGPQMLLYLNKGENRSVVAEARKILSQQAKNYRVLDAKDLKQLHYDNSDRVGDLVIDPDPDYSVGLRASMPASHGGNHGWQPSKMKDMQGIFYAEGPAFKTSTRINSFENVDIYPLIMKILGLKNTHPIDGHLTSTAGALKGR